MQVLMATILRKKHFTTPHLSSAIHEETIAKGTRDNQKLKIASKIRTRKCTVDELRLFNIEQGQGEKEGEGGGEEEEEEEEEEGEEEGEEEEEEGEE